MNTLRGAMRLLLVLASLLGAGLTVHAADRTETDRPTVRVGVLKFGTVNWALAAMQTAGLDQQAGIQLEIVPFALKDAALVALQSDAVDVIVHDWIWVSRQRNEGRDFRFVPYSRAIGGVVARADQNITTLADLRGRRLGVSGGAMDKSWLLLRAHALKTLGTDAITLLEPQFAAPPLLNQLVMRGELPAALNFWHYGARLKAQGMTEILDMPTMLASLGIDPALPLIGWVFRDDWAVANPTAIRGFLAASQAAMALLKDSDAAWETLRPMMHADDDASFAALKAGFRAGIPEPDNGAAAERAAMQAFAVLADIGGPALVGKADTLAPGTFWPQPDRP